MADPLMPQIPMEQQMLNAMPSGDMSSAVNPTPQWMPRQGPPTTPEELQDRTSRWTDTLKTIQSNPNMQQILLTVGARLLQGRRPGQSTLGGVAEAAQLGMMHSNFLDANAKAEELKQREMKMKEEETAANIEGRKATTESTRQATGFAAEKQPLELERLDNQAKEAALKLKSAQLEAKVSEAIDAQDRTGEKRAKQALDKVNAELDRIRAQTGASWASAAHANAGAAYERNRADAQKILNDPTATPEQTQRATTVLNNGKTGSAAKRDHLDMIAAYYKKANPDATEQDAAQYALELDQGAKGELLRAATTLYSNATDDTVRKDAEEILLNAMKKSARKPVGAPAKAATKADWERARNGVKVGEKYTGPDGVEYTRNK